jgi:hypothetical protein
VQHEEFLERFAYSAIIVHDQKHCGVPIWPIPGLCRGIDHAALKVALGLLCLHTVRKTPSEISPSVIPTEYFRIGDFRG